MPLVDAVDLAGGFNGDPDGPLDVTVIRLHGSRSTILRYAVSPTKWIELLVRPNGHRSVWEIGRWFDSQREAVDWLKTIEQEHERRTTPGLMPCANAAVTGCRTLIARSEVTAGRVLCSDCHRRRR